MTEHKDPVATAIGDLNQHIITVMLSRVASIIGIPAAIFLAWSMMQDVRYIEELVHKIDKRVLVIETHLNIPTYRFQEHLKSDDGRKPNGSRS